MPLNRRQFIKLTSGSVAAGLLPTPAFAQALAKPDIKAIAFDGFVLFDPRPIFNLAKALFPEHGDALAQLWFTKIFGYTWLRAVGTRYKPFDTVIDDALLFSAERLTLDMPPAKQKQLTSIWLNLDVWPDVKPALQLFKDNNIRLAFLSNFTEEMLRANVRNAGIDSAFEFYLSTDKVRAYKPSPQAYQMGI